MMPDLAGPAHWEHAWRGGELPPAIDPERGGGSNVVVRTFDRYFQERLAELPRGSRLLELGCGSSVWLPYFATRFGFEVTGLDYSPRGAELAAAVCERDGVAADIVVADLFDPPPELAGAFDVVVSFGVLEHFDDTAAAVAAAAAFARPGGTVITEVPNIAGLVGALTRWLDPDLYAKHVPLGRRDLADAYRRSGLRLDDARYLVPLNFGVVTAAARGGWRARVLGSLRQVERLVLKLVAMGVPVPTVAPLAPYVIASGTRS